MENLRGNRKQADRSGPWRSNYSTTDLKFICAAGEKSPRPARRDTAVFLQPAQLLHLEHLVAVALR